MNIWVQSVVSALLIAIGLAFALSAAVWPFVLLLLGFLIVLLTPSYDYHGEDEGSEGETASKARQSSNLVRALFRGLYDLWLIAVGAIVAVIVAHNDDAVVHACESLFGSCQVETD